MCLAQGHNTVTPVRHEPAAPRSRVQYSTTEPLCYLKNGDIFFILIFKDYNNVLGTTTYWKHLNEMLPISTHNMFCGELRTIIWKPCPSRAIFQSIDS